MKLWLRIALYIGGGGLIVTWVDPPSGLVQYGLILVLIVAAAYLDAWLTRPRTPRSAHPNVVSLSQVRQSRSRRHGSGGLGRERRPLRAVHSTLMRHEADDLIDLLRSEGMNPMMVSQSGRPGGAGHVYEVRLPEKEVASAKPLLQFFRARSAKKPS